MYRIGCDVKRISKAHPFVIWVLFIVGGGLLAPAQTANADGGTVSLGVPSLSSFARPSEFPSDVLRAHAAKFKPLDECPIPSSLDGATWIVERGWSAISPEIKVNGVRVILPNGHEIWLGADDERCSFFGQSEGGSSQLQIGKRALKKIFYDPEKVSTISLSRQADSSRFRTRFEQQRKICDASDRFAEIGRLNKILADKPWVESNDARLWAESIGRIQSDVAAVRQACMGLRELLSSPEAFAGSGFMLNVHGEPDARATEGMARALQLSITNEAVANTIATDSVAIFDLANAILSGAASTAYEECLKGAVEEQPDGPAHRQYELSVGSDGKEVIVSYTGASSIKACSDALTLLPDFVKLQPKLADAYSVALVSARLKKLKQAEKAALAAGKAAANGPEGRRLRFKSPQACYAWCSSVLWVRAKRSYVRTSAGVVDGVDYCRFIKQRDDVNCSYYHQSQRFCSEGRYMASAYDNSSLLNIPAFSVDGKLGAKPFESWGMFERKGCSNLSESERNDLSAYLELHDRMSKKKK